MLRTSTQALIHYELITSVNKYKNNSSTISTRFFPFVYPTWIVWHISIAWRYFVRNLKCFRIWVEYWLPWVRFKWCIQISHKHSFNKCTWFHIYFDPFVWLCLNRTVFKQISCFARVFGCSVLPNRYAFRYISIWEKKYSSSTAEHLNRLTLVSLERCVSVYVSMRQKLSITNASNRFHVVVHRF